MGLVTPPSGGGAPAPLHPQGDIFLAKGVGHCDQLSIVVTLGKAAFPPHPLGWGFQAEDFMKSATKSQYTQILVWLIWIIVLLVFIRTPESNLDVSASEPPVLTGIITHHRRDGPLFLWKYRLRVIIRRRRRALRRTRHRVVWAARLAKLISLGALTMAQVVN